MIIKNPERWMTEKERTSIIAALTRAAIADDRVAHDVYGAHPFLGESVSARTIAKAYRQRAEQTRLLYERLSKGEI